MSGGPADPASRLLVVEDDEIIGGTVAESLSALGFQVTWRRTGQGALDVAAAASFDLVLLDLGLPDIDGITVCRRVKAAQPSAVLVMLTARTGEMDIAVGLEAGADDYLTKPVRLPTLVHRIRAHLRRAVPVVSGAPGVSTVSRAGDLRVDRSARRASVAGHDVSLRTKEFDLLARLVAAPDLEVSRDTLMADVWDEHWTGPTRTLDVHVAVLRRKLAAVADKGELPRIVTVRGHGFRLETPALGRDV